MRRSPDRPLDARAAIDFPPDKLESSIDVREVSLLPYQLAGLNCEVIKVIEHVFIRVLTTKNKDRSIVKSRRVRIPCRSNVSFLSALGPPEHLVLPLFEF